MIPLWAFSRLGAWCACERVPSWDTSNARLMTTLELIAASILHWRAGSSKSETAIFGGSRWKSGVRQSCWTPWPSSRGWSTLHPKPCTLQPAPCILHPAPQTNPTPRTLHPKPCGAPCTLHPKHCTPHLNSYIIHPEASIVHPKHFTLYPTPYTLNPAP